LLDTNKHTQHLRLQWWTDCWTAAPGFKPSCRALLRVHVCQPMRGVTTPTHVRLFTLRPAAATVLTAAGGCCCVTETQNNTRKQRVTPTWLNWIHTLPRPLVARLSRSLFAKSTWPC